MNRGRYFTAGCIQKENPPAIAMQKGYWMESENEGYVGRFVRYNGHTWLVSFKRKSASDDGWNQIEVTLYEQMSFRSHFQKLIKLKEKGFPIIGYINLRPDPRCEYNESHCTKTGSIFINWIMRD